MAETDKVSSYSAMRLYRSNRVVKLINPVLRGWMNYFAVGHASECFGFVKDWVEKEDPAPFAAEPGTDGALAGRGG